MPAGKKRTTTTKNASKKAKTAVPKTVSFPRKNTPTDYVKLGLGFPDKLAISLKYTQVNASSATLIGTRNFRANGLFDPDITGVGHQPMYFDRLTALYNHFVVLSSTVTFKMVPFATTTPPSYMGCYLNDDATNVPLSVEGFAEQTTGSMRMIPQGATAPVTLTLTFDTYKVFGGSPLANSELRGSATADPNESSVFTFGIGALDGVSTVNYALHTEIVYNTVWFELKDQTIN